jgi:hypothetical protein
VGVAEAAGPLVVAVGEWLVGPSVLVSDVVVVPAEWAEVGFGGGSSVCPGGAVVEVAADCGYAAAGEDTGRVACFDVASLCGGGAASGDVGVDGC